MGNREPLKFCHMSPFSRGSWETGIMDQEEEMADEIKLEIWADYI